MKYRSIEQMKKENITYDTALPQPWFNEFYRLNNKNPWGLFVWAYLPEGSMFGEPVCTDPAVDWDEFQLPE